ncbi:transglycosylase SLT domain-containing protein [Salinicola sp. LHM]|uniref:transglycosylase SLT domain-containing protein n=1 Tax=Salinicola TaxID=404432 RepID=UPI000DA2479C|nr:MULTISPECIES: transglycosylase SLT domain-containing protein [Salinicola]MEC8918650.1 transglycosylase SLT domain-containing protein [Pseudomonadota bacterium]WQH31804.1 transglycosylase SLT domain-containing protein [Salinicola sp. LHM]
MPALPTRRRWLRWCLVGAIGLSATAQAAVTTPVTTTQADQVMKQALDAARDRRWNDIDQAAIEGHVLAGYVEYHRLRSRLATASAAEVNDFIIRYGDSPLSDWMRGAAQTRFGELGRYDDLLAISDGEPSSTIRQCYYYTALLDREPARAAAGGEALWHVGTSQPEACDPLFATLEERGVLTDEDTWERMMLAWENGQDGLVTYLERGLDDTWQRAIDSFDTVRGNYAAVTRVPLDLGPDGQASGALIAAAMHGLIRADTEAALEAWRKISPHVSIGEDRRHQVEHDLAFYSMVRNVDNNQGWVDTTLPRLADADLIELRIRNAVTEGNWANVARWSEALPPEVRAEAHWQYWLGRASEALGDDAKARQAYRMAAQNRSFFGFAAADRLGQPYQLEMADTRVSTLQQELTGMLPVVQRTEALMRIGEEGLARSEWFTAAARDTPDQAAALADYAIRQGWYGMAIQTTIAAKQWDALPWRFPAAYRDSFLKWAEVNQVDPYLLMGIARRESAFNPRAASPVGARGLMQLMPGTADHVARELGISAPSTAELFEPQVNIQLGSTYIRSMLERYRGNRIAATAAYNAGPYRVDRWLATAPREFDRFVESIPFRETRDYVQAVLAYRVIFESLAKQGDTRGVAMLSQAERQGDYDPTLIASN